MPSVPQLSQVKLSLPASGQTDFLKQSANIPLVAQLLQKTADLDNSAFQQGVFGVDPSLQGNIGSVDEMARLYGLGAVDDETRAALQRQTAYNALQGGYGAPLSDATGAYTPSSSMANAAQAVSVGQTAAREQAAAPALAAQALQASLALNPTHVDVGSTLISPGALLSRQDSAKYFNNDIENQMRLANAGIQQGQQTAAVNSAASGLGSLFKGMGGLSGMFGGGGGG